jgi:pimeloyl-ACP methyl ester carboxylesterase
LKKFRFLIIVLAIIAVSIPFILSSSMFKMLTTGYRAKPFNIQYPNMEILNYGTNTAYEFKNENSDKLIINIEGSGWDSVLGYKYGNGKKWHKVGWWYFIVEAFNNKYTILVPEKLNRKLGKEYNYYYYDIETIRDYTLEKLVSCYSEIINRYLSEHTYSSVILAGSSEGSSVLPLVYKNIMQKERITGIVAISYGGLSRYEQFKILANSKLPMPDGWRNVLQHIDEYKHDIDLYPESIGMFYGFTYIYEKSALEYRPLDDFIDINIPVLFIHGELDTNCPVESTRYIQNNLPNKPFEYFYFGDADHHSFRTSLKTLNRIMKDGKKWVYEHS